MLKTYTFNLRRIAIFCLTPVIIFNVVSLNSLEIRFPVIEELKKIMQFDREVSLDYFKPLYENYYSDLVTSGTPEYYLELELVNDEIDFPSYINMEKDQAMFIAYNEKTDSIIGLITFHKNNNALILDLLLVDKSFRNQGIGKKLVAQSFRVFDDIKECIVCPLRFGNENTLKFYETLGFKNYGPHLSGQLNFYGIKYSDMYFYYKLKIEA